MKKVLSPNMQRNWSLRQRTLLKNQPLESFSLDKLCAVEIDLNPELTLHSKGHILLYKVTIQSCNAEPKMMAMYT